MSNFIKGIVLPHGSKYVYEYSKDWIVNDERRIFLIAAIDKPVVIEPCSTETFTKIPTGLIIPTPTNAVIHIRPIQCVKGMFDGEFPLIDRSNKDIFIFPTPIIDETLEININVKNIGKRDIDIHPNRVLAVLELLYPVVNTTWKFNYECKKPSEENLSRSDKQTQTDRDVTFSLLDNDKKLSAVPFKTNHLKKPTLVVKPLPSQNTRSLLLSNPSPAPTPIRVHSGILYGRCENLYPDWADWLRRSSTESFSSSVSGEENITLRTPNSTRFFEQNSLQHDTSFLECAACKHLNSEDDNEDNFTFIWNHVTDPGDYINVTLLQDDLEIQNFTKTDESLKNSFCIDLFSNSQISIDPLKKEIVPTGIRVEFPSRQMLLHVWNVENAKHKCISLLDEGPPIFKDENSEILVYVINHGTEPIEITRGENIARLVALEIPMDLEN